MLAFMVLTSLLLGVSTLAVGQSSQELGAASATLVTQTKTILNADTVLGTLRDFEGMKIVPIVNIFFGFSSGSRVSGEYEPGIGSDGGGGITLASLLVITKDGEKRIVTAKVGMLGEILKAAMPEVLEYLKSTGGRTETGGGPATMKTPAVVGLDIQRDRFEDDLAERRDAGLTFVIASGAWTREHKMA
jgi:uncharacterized spore protein YtfJ